jgi:hypothetical protein
LLYVECRHIAFFTVATCNCLHEGVHTPCSRIGREGPGSHFKLLGLKVSDKISSLNIFSLTQYLRAGIWIPSNPKNDAERKIVSTFHTPNLVNLTIFDSNTGGAAKIVKFTRFGVWNVGTILRSASLTLYFQTPLLFSYSAGAFRSPPPVAFWLLDASV